MIKLNFLIALSIGICGCADKKNSAPLPTQKEATPVPTGNPSPDTDPSSETELATGDMTAAINEQYGTKDLGQSLLNALEAGGKDLDHLTLEDIAPMSEFHIGGRAATKELAQLAGIKKGTKLLDVGSGLGGPARTLAVDYGAEVTALELTKEYHDAAILLNDKVGVKGITFVNGDAMKIPAEDGTFDVVWMQHVQMNIKDKEALFKELARVLKPGGTFAWHTVVRGNSAEPVLYPVPWADSETISFMVGPDAMKEAAAAAGLTVVDGTWKDLSAASVEFFRKVGEKMAALPPEQRLGLNLLMGASTKAKISNMVQNLKEDRCAVYMGVFNKN